MRKEMDDGPQQQMVSRVSPSMLLLLVSEGLGGMCSKECVLRGKEIEGVCVALCGQGHKQ